MDNGMRNGMVIENGDKFWYKNDELHREDGPAVVFADGSEHWYLYGKLHREGGPAVVEIDGTVEWYLNGVEVEPF